MAQKNTLKFILLGLLSHKDMSGYDIKKLFDVELSDFWHANHSQIYPELRRLETAGFIKSYTEVVGEKLEKHLYTITEAGKTVFASWFEEDLSAVPPSKDEFPIKLYMIKDKTNPALYPLLKEEQYRHRAKLAYLEGRHKILFPHQEAIEEHYGHAMILQRAIDRERNYLQWLNHVISDL